MTSKVGGTLPTSTPPISWLSLTSCQSYLPESSPPMSIACSIELPSVSFAAGSCSLSLCPENCDPSFCFFIISLESPLIFVTLGSSFYFLALLCLKELQGVKMVNNHHRNFEKRRALICLLFAIFHKGIRNGIHNVIRNGIYNITTVYTMVYKSVLFMLLIYLSDNSGSDCSVS